MDNDERIRAAQAAQQQREQQQRAQEAEAQRQQLWKNINQDMQKLFGNK